VAKVATFWQGNCYIFRTLLFVVSIIEKGLVNWVEWFKMRLHKEMIVVKRKVGKVGNYFVNPPFTLVAKYYSALEYTKEDKEQPIRHWASSTPN
jgi:hypothetical protein